MANHHTRLVGHVPKKPLAIQSLTLHCTGGGAAFDRIVLAREEKDLPAAKP